MTRQFAPRLLRRFSHFGLNLAFGFEVVQCCVGFQARDFDFPIRIRQVTASRITRKSTRPRVADRTMVDTVQPARVLASFRNRSALSLLLNMQLLRWSKAKPQNHRARHKTRASLLSDKGLDAANHNRASGGGRRLFLTSPLIEQAIALIEGFGWDRTRTRLR